MPPTVAAYLAALPPDRREAIQAVHQVILKSLPKGYAEGMQYGMIGYFVPHDLYPPGYHCDPKQPLPFASLASQKNHMAVYLYGLYSDDDMLDRFRDAWQKTGRKLDMGKSCIRFKKLEDLPLNFLAQTIKRIPVKKFHRPLRGRDQADDQTNHRPATQKEVARIVQPQEGWSAAIPTAVCVTILDNVANLTLNVGRTITPFKFIAPATCLRMLRHGGQKKKS